MTTPRFWTDPLNGASYVFAQRLPSTHMNQYVSGLRGLDYALERLQATSWTGTGTETSALYSRICIDEYYDQVLILEQNDTGDQAFCLRLTPSGESIAARAVTGEPSGGWITSSGCLESNMAGTVMIGANTPLVSGKKAAISTDGEGFTAVTMNTTDSGVGVRAIKWDSSNSLWIAGLDGGSTTKTIETSPDGTTWTTRTNANANNIRDMAVDGSGTIVAISGAYTNKGVRSTDGVTWSEVTFPTTTRRRGITYSKGLGKWFSSGSGSSDWATSTDGQTWASGTINMIGTSNSPVKLGSTGNLVYGFTTAAVYMSTDGQTFNRMKSASPPSGPGTAAYDMYVSKAGIAFTTHNGSDVEIRISAIVHT